RLQAAARPARQLKLSSLVEAGRRYRSVRQLLACPAAPLGDRLNQLGGVGLYGLLLEAIGGREHGLYRCRRRIGRKRSQQRFCLARFAAVLLEVAAHECCRVCPRRPRCKPENAPMLGRAVEMLAEFYEAAHVECLLVIEPVLGRQLGGQWGVGSGRAQLLPVALVSVGVLLGESLRILLAWRDGVSCDECGQGEQAQVLGIRRAQSVEIEIE